MHLCKGKGSVREFECFQGAGDELLSTPFRLLGEAGGEFEGTAELVDRSLETVFGALAA